jgi:hypothetical protein
MSWRYEDHGRLDRTLEVAPAFGYINYHNYKVTEFSTNEPSGVPSRGDVERLALTYLKRLVGETNESCLYPCAGIERTQSRFSKKERKYLDKFVVLRGTMFARQLDGIRFLGDGECGGLTIEFGRSAKLASLELDWRRLEPFKLYKTLTRDGIVKQIRDGKAVVSRKAGDVPQTPSKLTISKVAPFYMSKLSAVPEDYVFPVLQLRITAALDGTNTAIFNLDCPIIADNERVRQAQ